MTELPFTPFDEDSDDSGGGVLGEFEYAGVALRSYAFAEYVRGLTFDTANMPTYVVLHHTVIPSATWARYSSGAIWDGAEQGMSSDAKKTKRLAQLASIKNYYENSLGWKRGPHLFVDDNWIFVMTPLTMPGVHAKGGNTDPNGHGYGIGIETIGYYEHVRWPFAVESNVVAAVTTLQAILGTFEWIDQKWAGGVSSHRDYNKPQCPGAAITPSYYLPLFSSATVPQPLPGTPPPTEAVDARFLAAWTASGGIWQYNRLTPGYALGPAIQHDGLWYQRFERSVARLALDGSVTWLLLSELDSIPLTS